MYEEQTVKNLTTLALVVGVIGGGLAVLIPMWVFGYWTP